MTPEISVVLTVYKRDNLKNQIDRILDQKDVHIPNIFVFQNESHVDITGTIKRYPTDRIKHIHNTNMNTKFHGRFTIPLWYQSEYWAIFDDDTMPNNRWLKHGIDTSKYYNGAIIGSNGRWCDTSGGVGDGAVVAEDTVVDTVGHCWLFPQERIYTMFRDPPFTLDNAEDIHFCCAAQFYDGVKCIVPRQNMYNKDHWSDTDNSLGHDEHATYKQPTHQDLRTGVYNYWKEKGWKPL